MHMLKNEKFNGSKAHLRNCVKTALDGQNCSIFGEAETEKSLLVSEIGKRIEKEVQVVCCMGIAYKVFK